MASDERDPGTSIPSETRQFVRRERLTQSDGGGPSGLIVVVVALIVIGLIVYAFVH